MAHIRILGTGGTIASTQTADGGAIAAESAATLADRLTGRHETSTRELLTLGSYLLDLGHLRLISRGIEDAAREPGVDGIVITHGTDTVEETAFLADLCHEARVPVVFTGAQRTADSLSADGPANLAQAIEFAATPALAQAGALIAFGGLARTARGARKADTLAPDPFRGGVPVAHLIGDRVQVDALPARAPRFALPGEGFAARRVDLIPTGPGIGPDLMRAALGLGAEAIVLIASGTGNAGPGFVDAVAEAVRGGVPVILGTRTPWGPVVPVYGNGGGVDLVAAGAIAAGDLNPYQARLLAAVLLGETGTAAEFAERFVAYRDTAATG